MEKKRGANWGVDEEVLVIEEVKRRGDILFGSFKGSGVKGKGKGLKEKEWQGIADLLNSKFDTQKRTWEEVKKKYYNIKTRSKEKLDGLKHPKTGGGPPLPPLSQGEETFLRLSASEPNMCGVAGGIDTDAPGTSDINDQPVHVDHSLEAEGTGTLITSVETSSLTRSLQESESRKRNIEELEETNLKLDNKRLEEEIQKIKEEKEILTLKKEVLILKKQKLILDIQTSFPSFLAEM
uniref:Myb/SANT-like DNA-binding domain-containing protein 4 n=1 Tax=Crassostrea virginica TaxID=6565 RepID=A0A8B8AIR0_CRAVI|nr:myb/SANT-like DNA-binding domain-containing protein 4 [Crassostrea virginica]